jgi:arsenate reductase (thioredoxin)
MKLWDCDGGENMKRFIQLWVVLMTALVINSHAQTQEQKVTKDKKTMKIPAVVVFVCEHGSAKSVVAAAHFNRLAKERNLKLRAVSRGTNPDKELPAKTIEGLRADGIDVTGEKPGKLARSDVAGATRVVTFCNLPEALATLTPVDNWEDVPPMSEDYGKFRDIVVERIKRLLDEMEKVK